MYGNINIPASFVYYYETLPSSPMRSSYDDNSQQTHPIYVLFDSESSYQILTNSKSKKPITPSFQRHFHATFVAILGFIELFSGLISLAFEFFIFEIDLELCCGIVYTMTGAATIVLVFVTDCERHQISTVLIIQLIALVFTIIEIVLNYDLYRKRCIAKANEPTRELTFKCQIIIIQACAAVLVFICTIIFSIIYFRTTFVVLKKAHGTFNMSNAFNLTDC